MLKENTTKILENLVANLPEIYQPIFGYPELSIESSRTCEDRLSHINKLYLSLEKHLNRQLRVLDLGCAQGFFSFNLAKIGACVHGIDFLDKNIAVCKEIAQQNPSFQATFEVNRVENVISKLNHDQYDLVIGLSVFHHIIHEHGLPYVQDLLRSLGEKCGACVFEFALATEPLYWGVSQPSTPIELLQDFVFTHELARHTTHLSEIQRPLIFASNQYWFLDSMIGKIDSWKSKPHALAGDANQGSRRYYLSENKLIKLFRLDHSRGEFNKQELQRESDLLNGNVKELGYPQLILSGRNKTEAWLVRELLPGRLLLDLIIAGDQYDAKQVVSDVLSQLVSLEQIGLYHNDVRVWNILVSADGFASLMDYGSIIDRPSDCVWPSNIFLSFFIFAHEVVTRTVANPDPMRAAIISPARFPAPYKDWIEAFCARPNDSWSFMLLKKDFELHVVNMIPFDNTKPDNYWQKAIEEAIDVQSNKLRYLSGELEKMITQAEVSSSNANAERERAEWLQNEWEAAKVRLEQLSAELAVARGQAEYFNAQVEEKSQALSAREATLAEQQLHNQWLQNEWAAAKVRLEQLSAELAVARGQAEYFNAQVEEKSQALSARETALTEQQAHSQWLQNEWNAAKVKIDELNHSSHYWWGVAGQLNHELQTVYQSKSWRITKPLRVVKSIVSGEFAVLSRVAWVLKVKLKQLARRPLSASISYVNKHPAWRNRLKRLLKRFPWIYARLLRVAINTRVLTGGNLPVLSSQNVEKAVPAELNNMTPHARRIYYGLKNAFENKKRVD